MTFEKRKAILLKKAQGGKIRVDLAIDEVSGEKVGYCASSVDISRVGENESIL